jgi:selenocysteine-specific translation elongation factor
MSLMGYSRLLNKQSAFAAIKLIFQHIIVRVLHGAFMGNLMVVVLGAADYSANLAKKGTSTDITLYNLKRGDDTVTIIEPARYPERLAPLFYAVSEAKTAVVVVDELSPQLGESLVMLQCCGISKGYFILRNYLPKEKVVPLIKGTILENYEFISDDPSGLKKRLLTEAANYKSTSSETGVVTVDHAFNVKGVGVVALGVVVKGSVSKHTLLKVLPGEKTAQIRSIQKHDDDFESATEGDRVGLALKNVNVEDVDRGTVLTNETKIKVSKILESTASLVKYWQKPLEAGMVLHLGHWMQFLNSKVETVNHDGDWHSPTIKLTLEKEIAHYPGDKAVLTYLEGGKLRVAGTLNLP